MKFLVAIAVAFGAYACGAAVRRGEAATPASDAYALGVTFYRLLTGIWYEPGPVADGFLAEHIKRLGKRLNEVPQFAAYAIADGIRRAFTRFGRWIRAAAQAPAADTEPPPAPLLPGFADLFDTDDG